MELLTTASPCTLRRTGGPGRWLAAALLLFATGPAGRAQMESAREIQIKCVYLFNFAQYVTWAPEAFADATAPLVIGVLGQDPLGGTLDEVVRGEVVNNRPLVVQRFRRVEDITTCHILFISRSETGNLARILPRLTGRNILTVSDTDRFAASGGVIRFVTENNKVRLLINVDAAAADRLTISSKLLRLAEIVGGRKS